VQEKPFLKRLGGGFEFGHRPQGETTGQITGRLRNGIFGRNELLSATVSLGDTQSRNYDINWLEPTVPLPFTNQKGEFEAKTFHHCNRFPASSFVEHTTGIKGMVRKMPVLPHAWSHLCAFEFAFRQVKPIDSSVLFDRVRTWLQSENPNPIPLGENPIPHPIPHPISLEAIFPQRGPEPVPSASIINEARSSLKSSLSYTLEQDTRDFPACPTKGHYISGSAEVAGLGGDVNFVKMTMNAKKHFPISSFSLGLSTSGGLIQPWPTFLSNQRGERGSGIGINDRFFLGGPLVLRGYENHVGPFDAKDALGGEAYGCVGATLSHPLPLLKDFPLHGHLFANWGSLLSVTGRKPPKERLKDFGSSGQASFGLGLSVPFVGLRVEVNLCFPLGSNGQKFNRFQLGIGAGSQFG